MPHGSIRIVMPVSCEAVFQRLHDYEQRLKWDTLLQEARLTDGWECARKGAVSICRGRGLLSMFAIKTEYVTFRPPVVAAVRMINQPLCFAAFAATIRHTAAGPSESVLEYTYHFRARPVWLTWLLHPVMACIFQVEMKKRLQALSRFLADEAAVEPELDDRRDTP